MATKTTALLLWACLLFPCILCAQDPDEMTDTEGAALAKQTQNPVSTLISLPFQNNLDFGVGPNGRAMNTLNIQPVYPFTVGKVNLINRTILPIKWFPELTSESVLILTRKYPTY